MNVFYTYRYILSLLLLSLLTSTGQVCIMIHSGSRGLGHQVATDALVAMEAAMARDSLVTNDRQLACARIQSKVSVVCCTMYCTMY